MTIDRIQLDARVVEGMTREFDTHPGWPVRQPRTVPDRSIGDAVVYADCPGCGWAVPAASSATIPGPRPGRLSRAGRARRPSRSPKTQTRRPAETNWS